MEAVPVDAAQEPEPEVAQEPEPETAPVDAAAVDAAAVEAAKATEAGTPPATDTENTADKD